MQINMPIPKQLPNFLFRNLQRLKLIDELSGVEFVSEDYKIYAHSLLYIEESGAIVDLYLIGLKNFGLIPYADVIMELAYDYWGKNLNFIVMNKGDNPLTVYIDETRVGQTEAVTQDKVTKNNQPINLFGKWFSFNLQPVEP